MNARLSTLVLAITVCSACATASTPTQPSNLGMASSVGALQTHTQDPTRAVRFTKIRSADWKVDREGLINLDHPKAQHAGLKDGLEDIQIYFYAIEHPTHGTFLIDTGVANVFRTPDNAPVSWIISAGMNFQDLVIHKDTAQWIEAHGPIGGVFLTHLHLDHIMGSPDVQPNVPFYAGPGEASSSSFLNLFVQGTTDALLENVSALREWKFPKTTDPLAVVDIFQDQTVFAIHTPGHTPGSTAYLINAVDGPHLVVGDACHTAWGWEQGVEPGTFSANIPQSARSLKALQKIASSIPNVRVHLGHQERAEGHAQSDAAQKAHNH